MFRIIYFLALISASGDAAQAQAHAGAEHAIIIDAGSAGSRVHVFSWSNGNALDTLREVCVKKIHPALSTFYDKPKDLRKYIGGLLHFAEKCIPPADWSRTQVSLFATAGLRKMETPEQQWIVSRTASTLDKSVFLAGDVKVLSGDEEALYDWLAVVAAFRGEGRDAFAGRAAHGVVDMGGESKQIAFSINTSLVSQASRGENSAADGPSHSFLRTHCTPRWLIQLPNVPEEIKLYTRSYNGFGLIASMNIVAKTYHEKWLAVEAISDTCSHRVCSVDVGADGGAGVGPEGALCPCEDEASTANADVAADVTHTSYHHPCYAPGVFPPGNSHELDYNLNGAGNFTACLELIREIFTPMIPNIDTVCMKHIRVNEPLVGIDGFPKISEILDLQDNEGDGLVQISPAELSARGHILCQRNWNDLHTEFSHYMPYRSQRACFGAVFIYYLLVDVYGVSLTDKQSFKAAGYESDISWTIGAAMKQALSASTETLDIPFSVLKLEEFL